MKLPAILLCLLGLALGGCGGAGNGPVPADPTADPAAPGPSATVMAQWSRNCALCHVRGEGGAPVIGDADAWAVRLAQGEDVLLTHTIAGLNNMPPLGYCMDCEEADFLALIRFMASTP